LSIEVPRPMCEEDVVAYTDVATSGERTTYADDVTRA
jgi:hypothetical protein